MINVGIKVRGLNPLLADLETLNSPGVKTRIMGVLFGVAQDLRSELERNSPVAHTPTYHNGTMRAPGGLRRSWTAGKSIASAASNRLVAFVRNPAYYGHIVEGGAKAHTIRPTKKALKFVLGGGFSQSDATVFSKSVRHPGLKGKGFVSQVVARMKSNIGRRVKAEVLAIYKAKGNAAI